jgi:phage gp46-like protein
MPGLAPIADLALRFDVATRRFDVAFDGADLAVDTTPATAMIVSLGTDGFARADDLRPDQPSATIEDPAAPATLSPRRGWVGDALDASGRRIGSRLWLLERAKQTEETRRRAEDMAAEALAWLGTTRSALIETEATWVRPGLLGLVARAGGAQVSVRRSIGAAA